MNRIAEVFESLRSRGETALVGFVTAGDPSVPQSLEIISAMASAGLDILELGIPFSDPTADGPAIQRSSQRALRAGVNVGAALDMVKELRQHSEIPVVLFTYLNPVLAYGVERFGIHAVTAGADGVLVLDLPPEESEEVTRKWPAEALAFIRLIAPTTPPERLAHIARTGSGFLYLVSITGVTGTGGFDLDEIAAIRNRLREVTSLPVCVGFGISEPEQVRAVGRIADGVVVGSAFERLIEAHLDDGACAQVVADKVRALKQATRA
jgi:tryptophan synthase alpha chain